LADDGVLERVDPTPSHRHRLDNAPTQRLDTGVGHHSPERRLLMELPPTHRWSDGRSCFRKRAQTRRVGPGDWAWRPGGPISSNLSNRYPQPSPLRSSTIAG